jgi:hypothetical protein
MSTKLEEIFEEYIVKFEKLKKEINKYLSSYEYEEEFNKTLKSFGQSIFQSLIGEVPKSKNERITIMTSQGKIRFPKHHPHAIAPGGFKISPYLQEQLCRVGTKMIYEEASEEIERLVGIEANPKQIERLCHYYGDKLEQVDWREAYSDCVQLKLPVQEQVVYGMIDGSMILTRQKEESWKEVKLCRIFHGNERVEGISKNRNYLGKSLYIAHLGGHEDFFEKVIEVLPTQIPLVFICDGAKWIWNWIEDHYPNSIQILDLFHCKEHLYAFAKLLHPHDDELAEEWVNSCIEALMGQKVDELLKNIEGLECPGKSIEKSKKSLYNYLNSNRKRINYGYFKQKGLLIGSGAIESAHRTVIQKRMKLSGQRWTISGAQQMLNLRVCYQSGKETKLRNIIKGYKMAS